MIEQILYDKKLSILNAEIAETQDELDVLIGKLESAQIQRTRIIKQREQELIDDAVMFPTFIGIDEMQVTL